MGRVWLHAVRLTKKGGATMDPTQLRSLVLVQLRQKAPSLGAVKHNIEQKIGAPLSESEYQAIVDAVWDFLTQGLIAPDLQRRTQDIGLHLTEYGQACLMDAESTPYDPTGYVQGLKKRLGQPLDPTVELYLVEGLRAFNHGHILAAAVMLGVASERLIDVLTEEYIKTITDQTKRMETAKKVLNPRDNITTRFEGLEKEISRHLSRDTEHAPVFRDKLDAIKGTFHLIRLTRNEATHPSSTIPEKDIVHLGFAAFFCYCRQLYELVDHFQRHRLDTR